MITNIQLGTLVLQELLRAGVEEFILCAGARNSPFVHILDENKQVKVYSFFEERSAAFFGLGRIALTRKPIAIITTSGTAVAELLPAAVEATYSSLPLIMITADRPKTYRGKGAPQSIEQIGIFSSYIEKLWDLDVQEYEFQLKDVSFKRPLQVNVCFDEPLIDGPVTPFINSPKTLQKGIFIDQAKAKFEVENFLAQHQPLILLGSLPEKSYEVVLKFLKNYKAPVYAEGISCLRGHPELQDVLLNSGEHIIQKLIQEGTCDSVIRIGGVPTARIWRDLESKLKNLPVLSLGFNSYSGLSREVSHYSSLRILEDLCVPVCKIHSEARKYDRQKSMQIEKLFKHFPESEPTLVRQLSSHLKNQKVYLGNSMPIRQWDAFAVNQDIPLRLAANRGANGIDGQVSTFLGWADPQFENWCLIGDLTAMYDLPALWITDQLPPQKLRVVVINNGGGQIFSRLFNKELFLNRHQIHFEAWAKMWNWSYQKWTEIPERLQLADLQIIEICPDPQQTESFWKELTALWKE